MQRIFLFLAFLTALVLADPSARKVQVTLKTGETKVIQGSLQGQEFVDYVFAVGAGQSLDVQLASKSKNLFFNVNPPGSQLSLYVGSMSGNQLKARRLPNDGAYAVRVYLMKPSAQSKEKADFTLSLKLSGQILPALPPDHDSQVQGTPYHATAQVQCSYYLDKSVKTCDAGVIRRGRDRTGTVELKLKPFKRSILFVQGKPVASDSSEPMVATRKGDMTTIRFGEDSETYVIPDVFLEGD